MQILEKWTTYSSGMICGNTFIQDAGQSTQNIKAIVSKQELEDLMAVYGTNVSATTIQKQDPVTGCWLPVTEYTATIRGWQDRRCQRIR